MLTAPTTPYTFNERTLRWHDTQSGRMVKTAIAEAWWAGVQFQNQMQNAVWSGLNQLAATVMNAWRIEAQRQVAPAARRAIQAELHRGCDRSFTYVPKARAEAQHTARMLFGPLSQFKSAKRA